MTVEEELYSKTQLIDGMKGKIQILSKTANRAQRMRLRSFATGVIIKELARRMVRFIKNNKPWK